jgi:mannose-6-phosphate isomerase-like protein (cupin superfamily)
MDKVNLSKKLELFDERWAPKIVGELNDYHLKLVKVMGEFVWHTHQDTDEFFMVLAGHLTIRTRDGAVHLDPGEFVVIPRGVEHCPVAASEAQILLIEPADTSNTGDAGGDRTAEAEPI